MWLQCQGMMARKYHLRTLNSPNDFNLFYAVEDRENDNESERESEWQRRTLHISVLRLAHAKRNKAKSKRKTTSKDNYGSFLPIAWMPTNKETKLDSIQCISCGNCHWFWQHIRFSFPYASGVSLPPLELFVSNCCMFRSKLICVWITHFKEINTIFSLPITLI